MINSNKDLKLAIIGLGYVGLPLALEFAKKRSVIGFDINQKRINELKSGIDKNLEFTKKELQNSNQINFTSNAFAATQIRCSYLPHLPSVSYMAIAGFLSAMVDAKIAC